MDLKIPSDVVGRAAIPLSWDDILFGYESNLIQAQSLIDFACRELADHDGDDHDLIAIASASPNDSLGEQVRSIMARREDSPDSAKKWALVAASYIAERDDLDRLSAVESIYSSFDYPQELAPFIRYMPMTEPDLGSKDANENRMLQRLESFSETMLLPADG